MYITLQGGVSKICYFYVGKKGKNPGTRGKQKENTGYFYCPQTKFAKVMFLHMSVCPRGAGGGIPACLAGLRMGGGVYASMPCRFPGPHPRGSLKGLARGVSKPTPVSPGPHLGVSPGPHQGGVSPCPHLGGLQAHTRGVFRPTPWGVYPSMY